LWGEKPGKFKYVSSIDGKFTGRKLDQSGQFVGFFTDYFVDNLDSTAKFTCCLYDQFEQSSLPTSQLTYLPVACPVKPTSLPARLYAYLNLKLPASFPINLP